MQGVHSQSLSKQDHDPEIQAIIDKRALKKQCLQVSSRNKDHMRRVQQDIKVVKDDIQRVEAKLQEAKATLRSLLREVK